MTLAPEQLQTVVQLLGGAIGGAASVLVAYALPRYTRHILVTVLFIGALAYVVFSVDAHPSAPWLLIELLGVGVYGTMAMLGLRGSPWWLVAGWAAHPLWDIGLHSFGPGSTFAPAWWTVGCLSWDLVVAGSIAYRIVRGWGPAIQPQLHDKAP
jgi:hypothetical protein